MPSSLARRTTRHVVRAPARKPAPVSNVVQLAAQAGDMARQDGKPHGWTGDEISGGVFNSSDPGNNADLSMLQWLGDTNTTGVSEQMLTDPAVKSSSDEWVERAQNADWDVQPGDPDDADSRMQAEFIRRNLWELSATRWSETIANATMAVTNGCALAEPVYAWDAKDETPTYQQITEPGRRPRWAETDRFDVGHNVLSDLGVRLPRSISRWDQREDGTFGGIFQYARQDDTDLQLGEEIHIPAENLCLWTYGARGGGNWAGVGRFRAAYFLWRARQTLLRTGVIAAERFGVGVPIAKQTEEDYKDRQGHVNAWDEIKEQLARYRGGSQAWLAATYGIDIEIMEASFTSAQHIKALYDAIAMEIHILGGTQFLIQGTQEVGTYGLREGQASEFRATLNPWLQHIADVLNRSVVKQLIDLNWPDVRKYPKITVGDQEEGSTKEDIERFSMLVDRGMPTQPEDWDQFREANNWTQLTEDALGQILGPNAEDEREQEPDEEDASEDDDAPPKPDDEEVAACGCGHAQIAAQALEIEGSPAERLRLLAESKFDAKSSRVTREDAVERISRDLHATINRAVLTPYLAKIEPALEAGDAKKIAQEKVPGKVPLAKVEQRGLKQVSEFGRLQVNQEIKRQKDDPGFAEEVAAAIEDWRSGTGLFAQTNPSGLENAIDEFVRDARAVGAAITLAAATTAEFLIDLVNRTVNSYLQQTPVSEWQSEAIRERVMTTITPKTISRDVAQDVNTTYNTARAQQARINDAGITIYTLNPEIGINGPHEPCPACVDTAASPENPAVTGSDAETTLRAPNPECFSARSGILTCWCSLVYLVDASMSDARDIVEGF